MRIAQGLKGQIVVEEEEFDKSYKLKVWHRFQIQNFSTYKEGRLKMLGPLLIRGSK